MSEDEQVFFIEEENETPEQILERKKLSPKQDSRSEAVVQIDAISASNVDEITNFTKNYNKLTKLVLEQSKDPILLQLETKIQKEDYSEQTL